METCNKVEKYDNGHAAVKLTLLCVILYACSYLCRKSFDSNINELMRFYSVSKSSVGLIGTFFFVAYAVGQVFHGIMCKRYNARYMVFTMALLVVILNVLMGAMPVSGFAYLKYLWLINGFISASFLSMIITVLHKCTANKYKKFILFAFTTPVVAGTFIIYGLSSLTSYLGMFKLTFYIAGGAVLTVATIWLLFSDGLIKRCEEERDLFDSDNTETQNVRVNVRTERKVNKSVFLLVAVFALFAVVLMLIRDGINTWLPTVLKEKYGLENWISVLLTMILPIASFFGYIFSLHINEKVNNYLIECGLLFVFATVFLLINVLCFNLNIWLITFICLLLSSCMMAGMNNIITNVFPLCCDKNVNAGMLSGILDGCCYIGSAISSYGIGSIADKFNDWTIVFWIFLIASAVCSMISFFFAVRRKKINSRR